MQQLDLWTGSPPEKRSHYLESLFQHLNWKHWSGQLPHYRCEWSNRMITMWGCCSPHKRLIRISSFFQRRPVAEVLALLGHEMIHIRYRGHGVRFRSELKRIGLEGDLEKRFPHLADLTKRQRRSFRYTYECPRCRVRIRRRRRIHGYCRSCFHSGVVSKFKLFMLR